MKAPRRCTTDGSSIFSRRYRSPAATSVVAATLHALIKENRGVWRRERSLSSGERALRRRDVSQSVNHSSGVHVMRNEAAAWRNKKLRTPREPGPATEDAHPWVARALGPSSRLIYRVSGASCFAAIVGRCCGDEGEM